MITVNDLMNDSIKQTVSAYTQRFNEAMTDDLNTPKALAIMHELSTEINKTVHPMDRWRLQEALKGFMKQMGFLQ